jgi:signal transduction histidine kinase
MATKLSRWGWRAGAGGLLVLGQVGFWGAGTPGTAYRTPNAVGAILICLITLPLALAERQMLAALIVSSGALLGYQLQSFPPSPADLATLALVVWLVATDHPRVSAVATATLTVAVGAVAATAPALHAGGTIDKTSVVSNAIIIPICAVVGVALRGQRARADLARRTLELESERVLMEADRAKATERLRIARELHDAVGHGITIIGLRAEAATRLMGRDPDHAARLLREVGESVRDAMAELHRMVGFLRDDGQTDGPPTPGAATRSLSNGKRPAAATPVNPDVQPVREIVSVAQWLSDDRLSDDRLPDAVNAGTATAGDELDEVIRSFAGPGLDIAIETNGNWDQLPSTLLPSVAAVVSEGLANVIRHASGHRAIVRLRIDHRVASVEVEDDGVGALPEARIGFGLAGLMERVRATGGTVTFENAPGGGALLRAILPLAVTVAP